MQTPTFMRTLGAISPESLPRLKAVFLGGEALTSDIVDMWWSPSRSIFNIYGPTEATTFVCGREVFPGSPVSGNPFFHV